MTDNAKAIYILTELSKADKRIMFPKKDILQALDMAIQALSVKTKWISVSDRLPEEEIDVLVCNSNGEIEISNGYYSTEAVGYFVWCTSGWRYGEVIAWKPLPEPYNAESEEEK